MYHTQGYLPTMPQSKPIINIKMKVMLLLLSILQRTHASIAREAPRETVPTSTFYDAFSTRIFDPQGRVLQLEYALQATKKGGAAVSE